MKQKLNGLAHRYAAALRKYLRQGARGDLRPALGLGRRAVVLGLETLDVARTHEQALALLKPSPGRNGTARRAKRAEIFFTEAITPIVETHRAARQSKMDLHRLNETLSRRTTALASANRHLQRGAVRRKNVEAALKKSGQHYTKLLKDSLQLQEGLRRLTHQVLAAQEDERKKISLELQDEIAQTLLGINVRLLTLKQEERKRISRELHDVIAQTLTGINVRLATLKKEAALNTKGLDRNIARTQRLVEKSVNIVHQFARELRPAVLDDLGLIPALHSFMKNFTARTGVRTYLKAFAGVEQLDMARRTVLFRIAQEALTNVGRHAQASRAEVIFQKLPEGVCMMVKDNGKSFEVERVLRGQGRKRLGLLGMRERLEMVGGHFEIKSAPGQGTTISAQLPPGKAMIETAGTKVKKP